MLQAPTKGDDPQAVRVKNKRTQPTAVIDRTADNHAKWVFCSGSVSVGGSLGLRRFVVVCVWTLPHSGLITQLDERQ